MKNGICALVLACLVGLAAPARAGDSTLMLGGGTWETLRSKYLTEEFDAFYRPDLSLLWFIKPQAGVMVAGDGDYYVFGGLRADVPLGGRFILTPNANIGGYGGGGYHLGSHFEFRTGVDLAYRFDNGLRLGVGFYHISNAGITRDNGGSESLLGEVSIPLAFP